MVLPPFGCPLMAVASLLLSSTSACLTACHAAVRLAAVAGATDPEEAAAPPASNTDDSVNSLGHAALSPGRLVVAKRAWTVKTLRISLAIHSRSRLLSWPLGSDPADRLKRKPP